MLLIIVSCNWNELFYKLGLQACSRRLHYEQQPPPSFGFPDKMYSSCSPHRGASDNGRINSGHTLPLAPHTRRAGGHPESQEMVAEQEDNPADLTLGPDFKLPALYSPHQEGLGPSPAHMRPQASTPCTCLHMYPHVPTHILTYPHVSTCPHASTCIHISTYIYTYPHASIHVQTHSPHLHVTTCIHTHPHPLTHIHRYPQVSTCIHIHTHQHTSTCIHMQPHTFTSIHTHSYTSTRIHTHPHVSTHIHLPPMCIHTHPHVFTCAHTHIYTSTHTHTCPCSESPLLCRV